MASDLATIAPAPGPIVRHQRDQVVLRNSLWLFLHGYTVDDNREVIIDPSGDGGFGIQSLAEPGLTPATR